MAEPKELNLDESTTFLTCEQTSVDFTILSGEESFKNYESILSLKNESNKYVALRIRTTKKDLYVAYPSYYVIKPNSKLDSKVTFTKKHDYKSIDISKHKFKIEGILLDNNDILIDQLINNIDKINKSGELIKEYFDKLTASGVKVPGTIIKRRVYHKVLFDNTGSNETHLKNTDTLKNVNEDKNRLINIMENNISNSNDVKNSKTNEQVNRESYNHKVKANDIKISIDKNEIELLKASLNKDLRYLQNLKEEYKLKKQESEMIKPSNMNVKISNTNNKVIVKEKDFSPKATVIAFFASVFLGFILTY